MWTNPVRGVNVAKASLGAGLFYTYFRGPDDDPVTQWYLSAIDLTTGRDVYRIRVGAGQGFNNWAGSLFLHPDGALYSTTIFGLVMVRDGGGGRIPPRYEDHRSDGGSIPRRRAHAASVSDPARTTHGLGVRPSEVRDALPFRRDRLAAVRSRCGTGSSPLSSPIAWARG
ncbi:MAG: hypothetical protein IPK07_35680 [Deltaproteobacteria bacterium]|nr:hypothetical protein [Deltaproteobacteria bacterium]